MSIDFQSLTGGTDPASLAAARKSSSDAVRKADVAKIKEMGFSAYVAELEEKKIEELRQKLLQQMGLSEESLAQLSPEQREKVEDVIAQEIQRRLAANSLTNGSAKEGGEPGQNDSNLMLLSAVAGRGDAMLDGSALQVLQGVSGNDEDHNKDDRA